MKVSPTDFQQNIGRYQDAALQAPVIITKHNRPRTVLMSAAYIDGAIPELYRRSMLGPGGFRRIDPGVSTPIYPV